jgi:phage/plasmid-like protein (TIGR03299 family)
MPAEFTSGWFGNNECAWHNQGVVTEGTLPARDAFETADALFQVEKRELQYPVFRDPNIVGVEPAGVFGVVRTDTQSLLGIVSQTYEVVQNEALLRMAEFIREEADMDSVIVLKNGARVAFTATLRGATEEVLPGDKVFRRLVGYLGHDGKTGCGAIFTNVRVVCANTLAAAMREGNKTSIIHKTGANSSFDKLITSIDTARQSFAQEVQAMRELAEYKVSNEDFRYFLEQVYAKDLKGDKSLDDLKKIKPIMHSMNRGFGSDIPGVHGTLWAAVNAVTEFETSTKRGKNKKSRFMKANFGTGLTTSARALEVAQDMAYA